MQTKRLEHQNAATGANPALLQSAAEVRRTVIPTLSAPKLAHRRWIITDACINAQQLYYAALPL